MNNSLTLVGMVGGDPETRTFPSGSKVTKFSVAVKEFSSTEKEPKDMWIDVEAWNGVGERVLAAVTKGREIVVDGRLAISEYDSQAKDGTALKVSKPVLKLGSFYLTAFRPKGKAKKEA
ncbi:MAG: single-stranded DNA-binding protein [Cyanobacteria bacterium SZAS LIN-3]|nr:single-stranded DNA-binding protein [Cyanobacteria bacterium SZAS LIN-3]MBS2010559.1 single-stranded DNA-binding protein [Cyanobacteria bacterium SZAS TMP-1]